MHLFIENCGGVEFTTDSRPITTDAGEFTTDSRLITTDASDFTTESRVYHHYSSSLSPFNNLVGNQKPSQNLRRP